MCERCHRAHDTKLTFKDAIDHTFPLSAHFLKVAVSRSSCSFLSQYVAGRTPGTAFVFRIELLISLATSRRYGFFNPSMTVAKYLFGYSLAFVSAATCRHKRTSSSSGTHQE